MKAGRELDALIAEKVMGLEIGHDGNEPVVISRGDGLRAHWAVPRYSTDIAAAWEVLEVMRNRHGFVSITFYEDYPNNRTRSQGMDGPPYKAHWNVCGMGLSYVEKINSDTAPMAICLAALKAVS